MQGTVRQDGLQKWWIEYRYPSNSAPVLIGVRWNVLSARRTGPFAPEIVDGLAVESSHWDGRNPWRAYAQGDYLCLECERDGTVLQDIPNPAPKVRKGVEQRYYCGQWQRLDRRLGWV